MNEEKTISENETVQIAEAEKMSKNKFKKWLKIHEKQMKLGTSIGALCIVSGCMIYLKNENDNLNKVNERLINKVCELKELCEIKDEFFAELASDALRHGSSLGAKHLADRKAYLNSLN